MDVRPAERKTRKYLSIMQVQDVVSPAQDLLILGLMFALFGLIARTLWRLIEDIFGPVLDFRTVIAEVLFILVMVEIMQLLFVFLREHRIAVDFTVELGIVSTLREIVLRGAVEIPWDQIVALALFLLVLGGLLRFGDLRMPAWSAGGSRNETGR